MSLTILILFYEKSIYIYYYFFNIKFSVLTGRFILDIISLYVIL